jgi:F0F1-type ATP synthase assembly protein I
MGAEVLGWLIDCIASLVVFVLIGYLISKKFKSKRLVIMIISVFLAVIVPTANFIHNMPNDEKKEIKQAALTTSDVKKKVEPVTQQTKFSLTELQNLFDKVIHDSNGGVLDISYAQQGDTIEVDVKVPKDGWDLVDESTKNSMVSQIGKGLELAVTESPLYTPGKEVYVAFMSDTSNEELANYSNQQVTIIPDTQESESTPVQVPDGFFTLGSSEDDVKQIQGVPTSISGDRWGYGLSRITFTDGVVSGWSEIDTKLKVTIPKIDENVSAFGISDSKQDVVNVMGTPTSIIGDRWGYGLSRVTFDGDRVSGWSEIDIHLKVK